MSRILRSVVLLLVTAVSFGAYGSAVAQAETGTVRVLNYFCSYLDSTMLVEAIDQAECAPGAGTFTFYMYGDGTDAHETLNVGGNGDGSITLAAGTYDMVAEETQTHFDVTVLAGQTAQLLIGNPAGEGAPTPVPPVGTGSVTLQRYVCSNLDSTLLVEAIEEENCDPLAAAFTFYLYGDGTADYYEAFTGNDGQGSAELPAGAYELVDEYSQTHFDVNVLEDQNVVLLIAGPEGAAPAPEPTPSGDSSAPTKLPSTGSGEASHTGAAMIAAAGTVAVLVAGAAIVRRSRENII